MSTSPWYFWRWCIHTHVIHVTAVLGVHHTQPQHHGSVSIKAPRRTGLLQLRTNTGQSPPHANARACTNRFLHLPSHIPPALQVSSELATQLSDTSLAPEVSPARRVLLDHDVRAKIGAEAARLRGHGGSTDDHDEATGVDIVQRELEAALERENLDRERGMTGDAGDGEHGDVKNSTVLLGDLEEVRQKVDRYRTRASLTEHPEVKKAREAIASCYQYVRPLLPSITLRGPEFIFILILILLTFPQQSEPDDYAQLLVRGGSVSQCSCRVGAGGAFRLFPKWLPITDLILPAIRRLVTVAVCRSFFVCA